MKRFKTRDELRDYVAHGWILDKYNGELAYINSGDNNIITIQMLKDLQGKTEEECRVNYPQYTYTNDMFTEEPNVVNEHILKKVLTETEYRIYLKGVVIENILHENFEEARSKLDELLTERTS